MRGALLLVSLLVLLASAADAATYYVAPSGDDAALGSRVVPWATLQHAVETVAPGDVIEVQSGAYAGCRIGRSGAKGRPCVLKAAPGAKVVLDRPSPKSVRHSIIELQADDGVVSFWVIEGFEVAGSPRYGIDLLTTEAIVVRRCHVHDSRVSGILTSFSNHELIEDNETHHNGEHGIYHANSGDDGVIRRNRIHRNAGCGLHMNADASMGGDGICSRMVVEDNTIWENGLKGGSALNACGVCDSIFRNNLCYHNYAGGISLYVGEATLGSSRNKVYDNTIVMAPNSRWAVNIPDTEDQRPAPVGNEVIGNILYSPDANRGSIFVYDPARARLVSDYNIVVDRFCSTGDERAINLRAWQAMGLDRHSRLASLEPLFVDPARNDYRLRPGSPARGAGRVLPEVPRDLRGVRRPARAPDAGAFQMQR